jgi:hypothetical protein
MTKRFCALFVSIVILAVAVPTFGGVVALTGGSMASLSVRGTDNNVDFQPVTVTLPSTGTVTASKPNVTASADYAFLDNGFTISNVSYTLGAAGNVSSSSDLYGQIQFTPVVDATYTVSGSFNWNGSWGNGVTLWARLQDVTDSIPGTDITNHYYSKSGVLTSASLNVTPAAGRPVTGTLLAGRTYEFDFELAADNNMYSPGVGTATGGVSISFVPEPVSFLLLLLGGLPLTLRRRR